MQDRHLFNSSHTPVHTPLQNSSQNPSQNSPPQSSTQPTSDSKRPDGLVQRLSAPAARIFTTMRLAACPARVLVAERTTNRRALTVTSSTAVAFGRYILCIALLLGLLPAQTHAAPNACPGAPGTLPDVIERDTFCVYFNDSDTTNGEATTVADHIDDYWDRYTSADFGFLAPAFTNKLEVRINNAVDCNGSTGPGNNIVNINNGCFDDSAEAVQQTAGHELFHRVEYRYHGTEVKWFKEGTARAMEDLAFTNIDQWPTALMAAFSFNLQANEYLGNTNVDITSEPQRYNSALWWKYFTEQFGTTVTEPQRGVDAMLALWEAAVAADDIAALNSALGTLGAGVNFDSGFRRFTAANYIKDLSNQPHATRYNYIDEDEAGNPGAYGPVVPTNGGAINTVTSATFSNQAISRYGARYYRADPSAADCPVVSANFHTDSGPAFYHVITQKGNVLDSFATTTAGDYSRAFFNDGITRIVAVAGSTNNSATVDVTLQCVTPDINIVMPNDVAVSRVGPFDGPGKFLAQVQVTNGSPTGPVVAGLTINDFKAKVNNVNALITAGGFIQEQYWLIVQAPNQAANGVYDLEITLEKSGTATPVDSDTNAASISYDPDNIDHLLVLDRSGSMLSDGKIEAARNAAKFYVDITRINDGLGVIAYNENVNPAPFNLTAVTAVPNVRQNAKTYIDGITATGLTSIGDGMREAVDQRVASPTGNAACSYILLSDGMENSAEFWATVEADAIATGCPVTALAFGEATDETLMQHIATVTGGLYFYNDVFVSAASADASSPDAVAAAQDTALDLANAYEYSQASSEQRQRLLSEKGFVPFTGPFIASETTPMAITAVQTHSVMIDGSVSQALFALDWIPSSNLELKLMKPDGTIITQDDLPYSFADYSAGHVGWRIANPEAGEWKLLVDFQPIEPVPLAAADVDSATPDQGGGVYYQVLVSGPSNLNINLLLPAVLGTQYFTGQRVPLYAFISSSEPISGLAPIALVTSPSGVVSNIPLYDDGAHDDGDAGDGFYANLYTLVNQAEAVAPEGESPTDPPPPKDEGSYQVKLLVDGGTFQREALGSFSVEEGADADTDGLPDPFEEENDVTGDGADPDLDGFDNLSEYQAGTDPNNSDTDGGGENDGSENSFGKDPFDPADDEIVAPEFLVATPNIGQNIITYDVQPEYNQRILYRATAPTGPWTLQETELPSSGVYSDTADNGTTYFYRYLARDADGHGSRVIGTSPATPSTDPFLPEAAVLVDDGAPTTPDLNVVLSFVPYGDDEDVELFSDIVEMKLSNDPLMVGADWQTFTQDVPWMLAATDPGEIAKVYAQFKDAGDNESLVFIGAIEVEGGQQQFEDGLFLPTIRHQPAP